MRFSEIDIEEKSVCGQYVRSKKLLGRGAFKDVYRGFDQIGQTEIAWNQICLDEDDQDPLKSAQSLCNEAVLLKSLHHNNIMECYGYWIDDKNKTVNMITELFPSGSLRRYIKKLGCGVDVQTIKNWGRQILQGLHYLHTQSTPRIVHRDIKCDNIFLNLENGEVKIGDFGLATALHESPLQELVGTPEFMAPEYYDEEYNQLVDIYSFGLCLMELATTDFPYSECTNGAQIYKKVSSGIKPMALAKVEDPQVKAIIEKCLLPVSLRPSAMELLKDPFFASEVVPMEDSSRSSSMISCVDFSSSTIGKEASEESSTKFCSSLEVAYSFNAMDSSSICNGVDLHNGARKCSIHDSVLSDISPLYKSMGAVSDAKHDGFLHKSYNYQSWVGNVSMNSKITFDSSSCAAVEDLVFCMSKAF